MGNRLQAGQTLRPGQALTSDKGGFRLVLQTDGNLVLYRGDGAPLWSSDTVGQGINQAALQKDGNFVLYDASMTPHWATNTNGHPAAFLVLQDDGNVVLYDGQAPLWSTDTFGGVKHGKSSFGSWLKKAARTTLNPVSNLAQSVAHLPVVSTLAHVVVNFTPIGLVDNLAHGRRLDHALVDQFKSQLSTAQEVAPYAQTVLTMVPGLGSGVSAAIAGGSAMLQGRRIDRALVDGLRAAVPGGPLSKAVLDIGQAAIRGDNISNAALNTLQEQLPGGQAAQLAANLARKIAKGENVTTAALDAFHNALPPVAQSAVKIGMALGHGQSLQETAMQGGAIINAASAVGMAMVPKDAILAAGEKAFPPEARKGFQTAIGLYAHGAQVTEEKIAAIRGMLPPDQKKAFDTATAIHIGRYLPLAAPKDLDAAGKAAFYAAKGLRGAPPQVIRTAHKALTEAPGGARGMKLGVKASKQVATNEAAKTALTDMRRVMRLAHQGHKPTLVKVQALIAKANKNDASALRTLKMLAVAERANRELDFHQTEHAGSVLGAVANAANVVMAAAVIPWNWVQKKVHDIHARNANQVIPNDGKEVITV